jgi:hypothetical protein
MAAADVERESKGREGRIAHTMVSVSGAVLKSPCLADRAAAFSPDRGLPRPSRPVTR